MFQVVMELYVNSLYPGMVFSGDVYDDQDTLVLPKGQPLTKDIIENLKLKKIKKIHYTQESMLFKQPVSQSMISEANINKAANLLIEIENMLKNNTTGIPTKAAQEVVGDFIQDIRKNKDAYLNLLELQSNDQYIYTHAINVTNISILIATMINLPEEKIHDLGIAALFHDIGKILIPSDIVDKVSPLTPEEWKIIKQHPVYTYKTLQAEGVFSENVLKSALCHHENHQGGGYPLGINHEKLNILANIISLADVFDAITSMRPYREAKTMDEAFAYIMEQSGKRFHPQLAQTFLKHLVQKLHESPLYPLDSYVLLNTGEIGYVVDYPNNQKFTLRPVVNIFFNPHKSSNLQECFLRFPVQINLEKDYSRMIVKRIIDPAYIAKFDKILGRI
ncbi:HD-GYP domain-containing protein [Thermospira aquatica]|uniref:HD-GYP domain-containing protein n=1 Tax=Thermospira aquatica TaxID=2828656 RepID=A0AAX3BDB5_9SPIR|nr:HD-GYP domain-containing protein [Thermospira aquatica]URA10029.1 HD-GYP domain-containing protein [Thermospira aquatica]